MLAPKAREWGVLWKSAAYTLCIRSMFDVGWNRSGTLGHLLSTRGNAGSRSSWHTGLTIINSSRAVHMSLNFLLQEADQYLSP